MKISDTRLIQRATLGLFLTQSVASAAIITSTTVNPLVAAQLSGQEALAGLPGALLLVGASAAAYPAGQLMGRLGRRNGLIIGCIAAVIGAAISGFSVIGGVLPVFLVGLLFLGAGRGTLDQARYAAAEINPPDHRGRALSAVIFGGTVGAILGPALVAPSSNLARSLGLQALAGPYFSTLLLIAGAALIIAFFLSMDLRGIAQRVAQFHEPTQVSGDATRSVKPVSAKRMSITGLLHIPDARIALVTMTTAQATMVMMMAIISLHMTHNGHDLSEVSLVTSLHVLGMFAFSPLIGQLADRIGRRAMIVTSAIIIGAGCVFAPLSLMTPWIGFALFLIGLGWSGCYVTGSALLTDAIALHERARMQGANDTMVNIASAAGSLCSGVLLQAFGFNFVSAIGLTIALLPLLFMLLSRPAPLQGQAVPAE